MTLRLEAKKFAQESLALVLIAALALATGAWVETGRALWSSGGQLGTPEEQLAGCHARGSGHAESPFLHSQDLHRQRPASTNHRCCLIGHDVAAQVSHYTQPSQQWIRVTPQIATALTECDFSGLEVATVLSADPPGTPPLRI